VLVGEIKKREESNLSRFLPPSPPPSRPPYLRSEGHEDDGQYPEDHLDLRRHLHLYAVLYRREGGRKGGEEVRAVFDCRTGGGGREGGREGG